MNKIEETLNYQELYIKKDLYLNLICSKVDCELERIKGGIPYYPVKGKYIDLAEEDISWWTNGFFSGLLWKLYRLTNKVAYREKAIEIEKKLDTALDNFVGLHHDVGFMYLHTSVAHYRYNQNEESLLRSIKAANLLAGRFNLKGNFLRAWNEDFTGLAIIDSMMNIPILYWASEELKDPRFEHIATTHAKRLAQVIIRPDGSSGHIASFNPKTGEFLGCVDGQGFSPDSCWSRGQAWAIYGFALSYRYTNNKLLLDKAIAAADYYIEKVLETDYIPRIDFDAPEVEDDVDTSAAVIACCGLLELENYVNDNQKKVYRGTVENTLSCLLTEWCDFDNETDGILTGGTVAYHHPEGRNVALVYSDYFLIEALLKLNGEDVNMW
ncbi:glycoside hydrolase family 88 protein [Granulicatella seriolae]|uniref:Glycoside hydrolase family 88 protein n=1 Tax=Granulicatella seriolae TaxID=2967226 RepID=A0ABT1WSB3_9LACT|nr:glycoside hydrolase family 88 protein [Granulicatella seriolae]